MRSSSTTRRRRDSSSRVTLGERFASAFVGAVVGALIGFALVWLFGVYSNRLGPGSGFEAPLKFVASTAAVFGVLGLAFGSHVGTLLGEFIDALFLFEGAYDRASSEHHLPTWLVIVLLVAVVAVVIFVFA